MIITSETKIAALLKANPAALEAIIDVSDKFVKLRNPLLRKLMAGRTSIAQACRIGGCEVDDFFDKLESLGFEVYRNAESQRVSYIPQLPEFIAGLEAEKVVVLDVRPVITSGQDPLNAILECLKKLNVGMVLKLVNSFEPIPLIALLKKQGYDSAVDYKGEDEVNTYFFKDPKASTHDQEVSVRAKDWNEVFARFEGTIKSVDVRDMEMPLPMITILGELDSISAGTALHVYHKRIPVFLLPELVARNFEYRIKEISDNEVHMLIFKA